MNDSLIHYANTDPDRITDAGIVSLIRLKEDLEALGYEVTSGVNRQDPASPAVFVQVETVSGPTAVWASGEVFSVHITTIDVVNDRGSMRPADIGIRNYRQLAAAVGLFAEGGPLHTDTLVALGVGEPWSRGWYWSGWESEGEFDGRPDVDFLTIWDPEGDEAAVIIDRRNTGLADFESRRRLKEARAQAICDAMNEKGWPTP